MPAITKDSVLDLEAKRALLKKIEQDDLLDLFKKKTKESTFTPTKLKKSALDQSVAVTITEKEKNFLSKEIIEIKRTGGRATLSSVMRNRALIDVDINNWKERALKGLKELNGPNWTRSTIKKNRDKLQEKLDNIPLDDDESRNLLYAQIKESNRKLLQLEKPNIKRAYRVKGRVTFNESNIIRWRAARLNLTVADYLRFTIFEYRPFTEDDKTLSVDARKRFYVSILDVAANGWGTPPNIQECPECERYIAEIKELKEKIKRLQRFSK